MASIVGMWVCSIFFNGAFTGLEGHFSSYAIAERAFREVVNQARAQASKEDIFEMRCLAEGV